MYSGRWTQWMKPRLLPSQLTMGSSAVIKQYLCTAGAVYFAQNIKPSQCSVLGGFWDKDVPSLFFKLTLKLCKGCFWWVEQSTVFRIVLEDNSFFSLYRVKICKTYLCGKNSSMIVNFLHVSKALCRACGRIWCIKKCCPLKKMGPKPKNVKIILKSLQQRWHVIIAEWHLINMF